MKTLFPALRATDLDASLQFYGALGYEVVGSVAAVSDTRLVMLALPDEDEVTLELVHRSGDGPVVPGALDHLAVQVDDIDAARQRLRAAGHQPGEVEMPGGPDGPLTSCTLDPDGHRRDHCRPAHLRAGRSMERRPP